MSTPEKTAMAEHVTMEYIAGSSIWSISPLRRRVVDWSVSSRPEDPAIPWGQLTLEFIIPNPIDEQQTRVAHNLAEKLGLFEMVDCIGLREQVYDDTFSR